MQSETITMPSDHVRRRNIYLALALVFFATSSMFIFGLKGMIWLMWRDEPLVAALLLAIAIVFAVLWWRTPKVHGRAPDQKGRNQK